MCHKIFGFYRVIVEKTTFSNLLFVACESDLIMLSFPGDASKAFPFQFGSISPGIMNVMTVSFSFANYLTCTCSLVLINA